MFVVLKFTCKALNLQYHHHIINERKGGDPMSNEISGLSAGMGKGAMIAGQPSH